MELEAPPSWRSHDGSVGDCGDVQPACFDPNAYSENIWSLAGDFMYSAGRPFTQITNW
jgi:hypothetical protein